jgi:hypothetical protein
MVEAIEGMKRFREIEKLFIAEPLILTLDGGEI